VKFTKRTHLEIRKNLYDNYLQKTAIAPCKKQTPLYPSPMCFCSKPFKGFQSDSKPFKGFQSDSKRFKAIQSFSKGLEKKLFFSSANSLRRYPTRFTGQAKSSQVKASPA
jgi:hypothetical protein